MNAMKAADPTRWRPANHLPDTGEMVQGIVGSGRGRVLVLVYCAVRAAGQRRWQYPDGQRAFVVSWRPITASKPN